MNTLEAVARSLAACWSERGSPLDACDNDLDFLRRYGLKMRGVESFDLADKYEHLVEPYMDDHPVQVYQAGAQTGKTVRLMTRLLRFLVLFWGQLAGYYFPDLNLPKAFSSRRFEPFVRSSQELGTWLGRDMAQGRGKNATLTRTLGMSTIFFLSTRGVSSTEGLPLQGVFFDEVRRMEKGDLARAMERVSGQTTYWDVKVSTALYPKQDINKAFMEGDQRWFHSECRCSDGVVLAQRFPDCIADLRSATPLLKRKIEHAFSHAGRPYLGFYEEEQRRQFGEIAAYICPRCGEIMANPRAGYWAAEVPRHYPHSYQMPQLLSHAYPASRVLYKYENTDDIQEFWNSTIGIPFLDPESQPVKPEHLEATVDVELRWGATMSERWRRKHLRNTAMGVDVQAGYNVCVIKRVLPNGKYAPVHVVVVHGDDPWMGTARLMAAYDVRCCVVDAAPDFSGSHRFAKAFPGRVFVASYSDTEGQMAIARWGDTGKKPEQRGADLRMTWTVVIERTKGFMWSLGLWVKRMHACPHPDGLLQQLPKQGSDPVLSPWLRQGTMVPTRICREVYWEHLQCIAFRKVYANDQAEREGKFTMKAEHIKGIDPHFAHADLYCSVAASRIGAPRSGRE